VEELKNLVVQHLFKLLKANLASMGKIVSYIVTSSVNKFLKLLQNALERYNKLAVKQSPPQPVLQYSEVLSYATLGDFDLLKHSRHNVLARLWLNTMHHQMAVKFFKLLMRQPKLRAHEEINWLNVKVRQLQAWVDNETMEIEWITIELSVENPWLTLFHCQQQVNIQHQLQLQCIYDLKGYSGVQPV
ncbi:hypothetical protein SCLCIDRAFT_87785, partial [Scleroderma citrinum Foug A]